MKVAALQTVLFGLTAFSAFCFVSSQEWNATLCWWISTMIFLINFWVLGVPSVLRFAIMIISGLALANQFSTTFTLTHLSIGLSILLFSSLLCFSQYAADVIWSIKTIVVDWLVCTFLVIITAVMDAIQGKQNLVMVIAYFCSSNIFSVVVMKLSETIMKWKIGNNNNNNNDNNNNNEVPCARYIHNLSIPLPLLPSLHTAQLLTTCWMIVFILLGKIENYIKITTIIPGWQIMAVFGFWGGLFCYLCPIVANKSPSPYLAPSRPVVSDQTLRQRRQN